jgi:hypothetical protein
MMSVVDDHHQWSFVVVVVKTTVPVLGPSESMIWVMMMSRRDSVLTRSAGRCMVDGWAGAAQLARCPLQPFALKETTPT